jgi:hypothetical protein
MSENELHVLCIVTLVKFQITKSLQIILQYFDCIRGRVPTQKILHNFNHFYFFVNFNFKQNWLRPVSRLLQNQSARVKWFKENKPVRLFS